MTAEPTESAESTRSSVQVRTSETSPVVRTLEVEVGADRVGRAYDRAYRALGRRARVRGFRPGRVPRSVLERLYGPAMGEEIERTLVSETLPEVVERSGLHPVTEPQVESQPPAPDASFRYTARLEVKPEIELGELRGLPARRTPVEVTDEDVETRLEALRQRNAQLIEEPQEIPVANGHVVHIDFSGRVDGKPFEGGTGRDVPVEVGSGRFLPGFEEQLVGARSGEDREVRVRLPDDHPSPELAGKEAVFDVHVAAVRRREVPELDDELAKDLGDFESLAELRERVREDLRAAREREARSALRRSLLDALIERHPFEVPPGLVERRLEGMLAAAHQQLQGAVPEDALHAELGRMRESWRPRAEREVRETLLLEAVQRREGIEVDDAAVDERLDAMAREQGAGAARLRKAYARPELRAAVRGRIAEERALEFLEREAKVEEVPDT